MIRNRNLTIGLLAALLAGSAAADDLADQYFSKDNPALTKQERAAIAIANGWRTGASAVAPVPGPNGVVQFLYGGQPPSIVCAVFQICDIALQAGELINSIHLGDTARWTVEPAITGSGAGEVQHLIVKPMDVGLNTSMVVTTNRRTYHLKLRSHRTEYMPQVAFTYPEDALAKWEQIQHRAAAAKLPESGQSLENLSFDYDIEGAAPWKPERVYHDEQHTFIEMPKAMSQTEAPSLLVVRQSSGLFGSDETVMVNYRVQNSRYIVDTIFDEAILIAGVGNNQDRITITRRKP